MYSYRQYPAGIIPHIIAEAQESKIPVPNAPQLPVRPTLEKMRYTGFFLTAITALLIVAYKFSIVPSNAWLTAMLTVFLVASVSVMVYNVISNRFKKLANQKTLENYEYLISAIMMNLRLLTRQTVKTTTAQLWLVSVARRFPKRLCSPIVS